MSPEVERRVHRCASRTGTATTVDHICRDARTPSSRARLLSSALCIAGGVRSIACRRSAGPRNRQTYLRRLSHALNRAEGQARRNSAVSENQERSAGSRSLYGARRDAARVCRGKTFGLAVPDLERRAVAPGEKEQQSSKRSDLTDKLREHITQYLATSGLFPENGQHGNVRDSLIKCRDSITAPLTEEQTKLNWFDEEIEHCLTTLQGTDRLVCHLVTEIKSLFSARVRLQRKE
jgi:hypothetical protein